MAENQGKIRCHCGCDQPIPLRVGHFHEVPQFLHGHNRRGYKKYEYEPTPCACGCGTDTTPGKRFRSGHNSRGRMMSQESRDKTSIAMSGDRNHRYGKQAPNYLGRVRKPAGYIKIVAPDHPFARQPGNYVLEHRLVLEAHLREHEPSNDFLTEVDGKLYLQPKCHVHHINHVKDDNRLDNLVALTPSEHSLLHRDLRRA